MCRLTKRGKYPYWAYVWVVWKQVNVMDRRNVLSTTLSGERIRWLYMEYMHILTLESRQRPLVRINPNGNLKILFCVLYKFLEKSNQLIIHLALFATSLMTAKCYKRCKLIPSLIAANLLKLLYKQWHLLYLNLPCKERTSL